MPKQNEEIEKYQLIGIRSISSKGGSLQVTIPSYAKDYLNLSLGEPMAIYLDKENERLYISKISEITTTGDLKFKREKGKWKLIKGK